VAAPRKKRTCGIDIANHILGLQLSIIFLTKLNASLAPYTHTVCRDIVSVMHSDKSDLGFGLHATMQPMHKSYTVPVKKSPPPRGFLTFFPNGWEFLVQILDAYYTFLYTIGPRIQIFIHFPATLTKLCHIKCDHPALVSADGGHFEHMM